MRILITGCNGQVGHCLVTQLAKREEITVLSLDKQHLDVTNQDSVNSIVYEFQPTIIINAAAYTAVDKAESEVELSYAINRDGPKYLASAAKEVGAAILHISTDYVFEGDKVGEYYESDITNPQGVYGKSKLEGELAVIENCEQHIILRTAWVFGENGNNFVKTMLRLGAGRDELSIVGDQLGGPTYAGDIAAALIHIAEAVVAEESVEYGVYHFSGLPYVSWYEFAQAIFIAAEKNNVVNIAPKLTSIKTAQYPTPAKRPSNSKLDMGKISKAFSIKASDWQTALENIKAYTGR